MKKGAIFDMDGLLTDTERWYAASWKETAREFGQAWVPDFDKFVAGTSGEGMRAVIHTHFPAVDADAFMNSCIQNAYRLGEEHLREMPGASDILRFLSERGVRLALASSSPGDVIHRYLRKLDMERYFDAVANGYEVAKGKPAPDIFLLAAARIGCAPEDCFVFEDGINGCLAGIAAGCATVMIPDLFQPTEELKRGCTAIYGSLREAMDAIADGRL